MGVRSLFGFIQRNKSRLIKEVDLVQLAGRNPDGLELLVDLGAFLYALTDRMPTADPSGSAICGRASGDYQLTHTIVTRLVSFLRKVNVKLVIIHEDYKRSRSNKLQVDKRVAAMFDAISAGEEYTADLPKPFLLETQVKNALFASGCEMIGVPRNKNGSAATVRMLHQRPNAYAILTNDTGFCVFKDAVVILMNLYDLIGNIMDDLVKDLGSDFSQSQIAKRMIVGTLTQADLQRHLKFGSHADLVDLSIILGNEETNTYTHWKPSVEKFAPWVQRNHDVKKHELIRGVMATNESFGELIDTCRSRYALREPEELPSAPRFESRPELFPVLCQRMTSMEYNRVLLDMHESNFFSTPLILDRSLGNPQENLTGLRRNLFEMLMDPESNLVCEYLDYADEQPQLIELVRRGDLPLVSDIDPSDESRDDRIKIFVKVATEADEDFPKDLIQKYAAWMGFKLYLIRLFLRLNVRDGLYFGHRECDTVAAAILSEGIDTETYTTFRIHPSRWTVTVISWAQDFYYHLHSLLGTLLFLSGSFPEPRHIFPPVVWNAFLLSLTDNNFPESLKQLVAKDKKRILQENRELIDLVTAGLELQE